MRFAVLIALAACGDSNGPRTRPHDHAPVDKRLELALVVPRNATSIAGHSVSIHPTVGGLDVAGLAAHLRRENPRSTIGTPERVGDGWFVPLTGTMNMMLWYRSLGAIGITCAVEDTPTTPFELTKASCFGAQLLADGIYVPFALDRHGGGFFTDKKSGVDIYLKPGGPGVPDSIEAALTPSMKVLERVTFDGGWGVVSFAEYMKGHEYMTNVRRTIGTLDVLCSGDGKTEEQARAQLRWCLQLEPL